MVIIYFEFDDEVFICIIVDNFNYGNILSNFWGRIYFGGWFLV